MLKDKIQQTVAGIARQGSKKSNTKFQAILPISLSCQGFKPKTWL
jgi:hypothetical protein